MSSPSSPAKGGRRRHRHHLVDRSGPAAHEVQVVDASVDQEPAAHLLAPAAPPGRPAIATRRHRHLPDGADRAIPQVRARRRESRREVHVLAHHEDDAGRSRRRQDRVRLGERPRDGLLEQDGLPVPGGQARVRLVQVMGRADHQRVDPRVGRRRLVRAEGGEPPEAAPVCLRPRRIAAGEREPHRAAQTAGRLCVERREPPASHQAQAERTGAGPSVERSRRRAAAHLRGRHGAPSYARFRGSATSDTLGPGGPAACEGSRSSASA